jgi:hypothetical protein
MAFTPSGLDHQQILQYSYDPIAQALRTTATLTAPLTVNGELLVSVTATDGDSVIMYGTQNGQSNGTLQIPKIDSSGNQSVINVAQLIPVSFDSISITNSVIDSQTVPTEIEYYSGGLSGTLVATLTLGYDSSANLTSAVRT